MGIEMQMTPYDEDSTDSTDITNPNTHRNTDFKNKNYVQTTLTSILTIPFSISITGTMINDNDNNNIEPLTLPSNYFSESTSGTSTSTSTSSPTSTDKTVSEGNNQFSSTAASSSEGLPDTICHIFPSFSNETDEDDDNLSLFDNETILDDLNELSDLLA